MSTTLPPKSLEPDQQQRSRSRATFARLLKNPAGLLSLSLLALIILIAIFGPLFAPHDPNEASAEDVLAPLSGDHPFGADSSGRDVLSRFLVGTRYSLLGALIVVCVAGVIGIISGLVAGYFGKWFENLAAWTAGLLQSLPGMVVLLAVSAVIGPWIFIAMAIFGIIASPAFYRLVYAAVAGVRNELYVDAARVMGISDARIIGRHILTVVRGPVLIQTAGVAALGIGIQSGLEFIGLGQLTIPTWGTMLNDGFANIYIAPLLMLWPSLGIAVTTISLVLLANALRDALEGSSTSNTGEETREPNAGEPVNAPIVHDTTPDTVTEDTLDISALSVCYGDNDSTAKRVVNDVSLTVSQGEVHGLIGESGSGKTQTAWSVLRLLPSGGRICSGSVKFQGTELTDLDERQMASIRGGGIAYIPQEPMSNLDPSFRVGNQLVEPIRKHRGVSKKEATHRALNLLERVGISDPKRTFAAYPHEISGGMAQRVLIARAVSCDPQLLIADEPTTALDVTVQADVLDLLRSLQNEMGMSILLVTHNFGVVADICDRVSVMQQGRIVESGGVNSVFNDPRHPYTQSLFDAILDGRSASASEDGESAGEKDHA